MTAGCRRCNTKAGFYPTVSYNARTGISTTTCKQSGAVKKENQSCGVGSIYQKEGVIKVAEKLVCKSCSDLIPHCLACDSASKCIMCMSGYHQANLKDAFLKTHVVCFQAYCGFYGNGPDCNNSVGIEGCDKSNSRFAIAPSSAPPSNLLSCSY